MDRRQLKTRAAVFQAFADLLGQKPYSQITVHDIITAANIGRSTFYSHFETKDLLLEALCHELFDHVFGANEMICDIPGKSFTTNNYQDLVEHILCHLLQQKEMFLRLLRSKSSDLFLNYFKKQLSTCLGTYWLQEVSPAEVPTDYLLNHFTSTFVESIHWWVRTGMKQTPSELAHYFVSVMDPLLQTK